jgi:hypothetical protein|tara:strand:- start:217 stop:642 length:426 start_codon:yes stop_codon:yes gene_type:complete
MSRYELSSIEKLDEGRFIERLKGLYRQLQEELRKHEIAYGQQHNKGQAKLTAEFRMYWERPKNAANSLFYVEATTKAALPQAPPALNMCLPLEDDNGVPGLFVQSSGSRNESPAQGRLCTDDGQTIDTETGEVLENDHVAV